MSRGNDKLNPLKKAGLAFYLFGVLGMLVGAGRVLWLFYSENYSRLEIWTFGLNYTQFSLNHFVLSGLGAGLAFAFAWVLFERIEGLFLSAALVALPLLPLAYWLNKNVLPGRFSAVSLVCNALVAGVGLASMWGLFRSRLSQVCFMERLFHKGVLVGVLVVMLVVNAFYSAQPDFRKLAATSPTPDRVRSLLDPAAIGGNANSQNSGAMLHKHFAASLDKHLRLFPEKVARRDTATILAAAEAVLNHEFEFLNVRKKLGKKIDWRKNPTGDREWLLSLNRMDWLWELAAAYQLTGVPRYAQGFDEIMRAWLRQNRVPRWKCESDNVWRLIESSTRVTDSWIEAFAVFYPSPEVGEDVRLGMLASLNDHAQFLAHFRSPRRNHLLQETYGLLAVAAAFPEFKMAPLWLAIARERLDGALRADVYPDGGYNEGSTYYHRFAVRILQQISDFAGNYGVSLSDFFYDTLQSMYSFLLHTAHPDGFMAPMNDGFHAKNLRPLFDAPAQIFDRNDFKYFASAGHSGTAPSQTSIYYPYSGIAVMRSDWNEQARYAIFDAGLFGSSHGHEDKLSFELYAFGHPLLVESGTFTYVNNRWRRFFRSSFAHNTIVVDGKSQMRYRLQREWVNDPPVKLPNAWVTNDKLDYIASSYDRGYGNIKEDVEEGIVHKRHLLFVKPDYWILWDVVRGVSRHDVRQFFHFPADAEIEIDGGNVLRVAYGGRLSLVQTILSPLGCEVNIHSGEETPIQGWVSPKYGVKQPAPAVEVVSDGNLPAVFVEVLLPSETARAFTAELLPVTTGGKAAGKSDAIALKVSTREWEDTVLLSPGVSGTKAAGDVRTSAAIFLRRQEAGKIPTATEIDSTAPVR